MPTLVFTDSYGRELFRYSGFIGAPALSALLQSLPHDVSDFNRLSKVLDRNRNTLSALNAMGKVSSGPRVTRESDLPASPAARRPETRRQQRGRPC